MVSRRRWLSCPESRVLYSDLQGAIKSLTASHTDREPQTLCQRAWALAVGPVVLVLLFLFVSLQMVFSSPSECGPRETCPVYVNHGLFTFWCSHTPDTGGESLLPAGDHCDKRRCLPSRWPPSELKMRRRG